MRIMAPNQQQRIDICNSCEFLKNMTRCGKCGCFILLKSKFIHSKCPIGKWKQIDEEALNASTK